MKRSSKQEWVRSAAAVSVAPSHGAHGASNVGDEPAGRDNSSADSDEPDESERPLEPLPQAKLWLVDGYNVLHCAPFYRAERAERYREVSDRSAGHTGNDQTSESLDSDETRRDSAPDKPFWSESMRERLVAVARCFPDRDAEIWLVFDGTRTPEDPVRSTQPELRLQFAPSADDWIVRRVRDAECSDEVAVVSGDRRLTGRTRHHGAAVVSPRHFLHHCFAAQSAAPSASTSGDRKSPQPKID